MPRVPAQLVLPHEMFILSCGCNTTFFFPVFILLAFSLFLYVQSFTLGTVASGYFQLHVIDSRIQLA